METGMFKGITNAEVETLFEEAGVSIVAEEAVWTQDTLQEFEETARTSYASYRYIKTETIRGHQCLVIRDAQLRKGQRRGDILVMDMGEYRLCYSPTTIR